MKQKNKSIRAFVFQNHDFYYPDDKTNSAYSEFYAVLEGYNMQDKKFEISHGSETYDREGIEIFNDDVLQVYVEDKDGSMVSEVGTVIYDKGSFTVTNNQGMSYDLNMIANSEGIYTAVCGNVHGGVKV